MRTVPAPAFPTGDDAIAWMDAPGRIRLAWRDERALELLDGLLEPHGLEIEVIEFQGDPYVCIIPRSVIVKSATS